MWTNPVTGQSRTWACENCGEARDMLSTRGSWVREGDNPLVFCDMCDPEPGRPRVDLFSAAREAWPHATEENLLSRVELFLAEGAEDLAVWDEALQAWVGYEVIPEELCAGADRLLGWFLTW